MRIPAGVPVQTVGLIALLLLATLGEGGGHPLAILSWHAGVVALLVGLALRPGGSSSCWRHPGFVPFGLFLLLVGLGAARAPYSYAALLLILELAACVALAWIAASAGDRLLPTLSRAILVGGSLQSLYVIGQVWLHGGRRAAGTFLNANHLGLWLVAALMLGLGSTQAWRSRRWRIGNVALALPIAGAIGLSGSRGAAVAVVGGRVTGLLVPWRKMHHRTRVAVVSGILVVVSLVGWRQGGRSEQDPFRHHRFKIWTATVGSVSAQPMWGSGPGQFGTTARNLSFPDGDGPLRYDRAFSATHSDYLRVPAEFGLPAALAAFAALALGLRGVLLRRRAGRLSGWCDGAMAGLAAIGAQALVDNPSRWPAVYLLGSVLIGSLLPVRALATQGKSARFGRVPRTAGALGLVLFFCVADVAPFLAWSEVQSLPRGRLDPGQLARLERALRWNPLQPESWNRLAEHRARDAQLGPLGAYAAAREAAETAVRLDPRSARYRRELAQIEAAGCRSLLPTESCRARVATSYREAAELSRYDPFIPVALAMFLVDMGDPAAARRAAERALSLEPEAVLPRLVLVDALIENGTPQDLSRAAALFEETREQAALWSEWSENDYGRSLLAPDPRHFERVERKLAVAASSAGADGR